MNLQEILTYVEELSFKNAMFNGYDKDEVDIQLDKICDEVEALVTEKDKEIDDLKAKLSVVLKDSNISSEELAGIFANDQAANEDMISREEYDAVVEECAQLKVALEQAQAIASATKAEDDENNEAVKLLVGEIDAAKARAAKAEEETAAAKAELEALKAEIKTWQEAEASKVAEEIEAIAEPTTPVVEEPAPEPAPAPASTDAAYNQYMMYADLLCKQLAEVEVKHEKIVSEATVEADGIRAAAQEEADKLIADAQGVYDARNAEASEEAQGIVDAAKAEAEDILQAAKDKAEIVGQEYMAKANEAKEECEALQAKKADLLTSLSGFGDEIAALIAKVQG